MYEEMKEEGDIGLGEDWQKLIKDFEILSEYYDEGNRIMSFGKDISLRTELLDDYLPERGSFLDVGSGPGTMTLIARRLRPKLEAVLLDPVVKMLNRSKVSLGTEDVYYVCGIYEFIPFRSRSFCCCLAGFTIRDARNRLLAFQEISRILREDGNFIMIDLGKPDSWLKRLFVTLYWRFVAPTRLKIALGERAKPYTDIYITYRHLPPNSVIVKQLREAIGDVTYRLAMLDGVLLVNARKSV